MGLIKTLATKPWLADDEAQSNLLWRSADTARDSQKWLAFKFLMAVVAVVFFLFLITFIQRSQSFDFQALAGAPWLPFEDMSQLWLSTSLLFVASLAAHLAWSHTSKDDNRLKLFGLLVASALVVAFIFSQLQAWQHLDALGFGLNDNPASSYFYLLTAVHGLHVLIGLFVLIYVSASIYLHKEQGMNLKLVAWYLHFMWLIWCGLFYLLTRDAATFNAIARFCGFG